jgi:hypothetical protein
MVALNKLLYLVAVLSYVIGLLLFLGTDSLYLTYYIMILPICGIMHALFGLVVNDTKIKGSDLFRFFFILNSLLFAIISFINEEFTISSILVVVSSIVAFWARNTDKYWATKSDHS